ncbi:MAG TPA: glycosyltransferase family 2 protein [Acidimicrobiia bacterium]|nr:glycosyltransferase family 2 protein [Acidimicrobiia bacterium]
MSASSGPLREEVRAATASVRVVVVDYDGGELTLECLRALMETDWDPGRLEIVLVDNGSRSSVADRVRAEMPTIRIMASDTNLGFAGGNNLALGDLTGIDFVALINNDVTVEPGWLRPLVETLQADPALGATCPKLLLRDRFRRLEIVSPVTRPRWPERRSVGVRISGIRSDGDLWPRTKFPTGTWGPEWDDDGPFRWTSGAASILVPVPSSGAMPEDCELRLDAREHRVVRIVSGSVDTAVEVGSEPAWHRVPIAGSPFDVVNSVGTETTADGYGIDRGYLEEDRGQFETGGDVFGWHGGAVLLRSDYLHDIGLFDERLFLYYEDLELSWRGREHGWRYRYVPASVVRHVHAATASTRWLDTAYYTERNRLLVLARHASLRTTARAATRFAATTVSYAWRDAVAPLLLREPPRAAYPRARARALGGFLAGAPGALRSRRSARRAGPEGR